MTSIMQTMAKTHQALPNMLTFYTHSELKDILSEWHSENPKEHILTKALYKMSVADVKAEFERVFERIGEEYRREWVVRYEQEKAYTDKLRIAGQQAVEAGWVRKGRRIQSTIIAPYTRTDNKYLPWNKMHHIAVEITSVAKNGAWFEAMVLTEVDGLYDLDVTTYKAYKECALRVSTIVKFEPYAHIPRYGENAYLWRSSKSIGCNNFLVCTTLQLSAPDDAEIPQGPAGNVCNIPEMRH